MHQTSTTFRHLEHHHILRLFVVFFLSKIIRVIFTHYNDGSRFYALYAWVAVCDLLLKLLDFDSISIRFDLLLDFHSLLYQEPIIAQLSLQNQKPIYISKGRFLKSGSLDVIGQFSGMECFARFSNVSWGGGRLRRRLDFDWLNPRRQHHATMATYDLQQMYSVQ